VLDDVSDMPTAKDNMLYLMLELESSIEMSAVEWSPVLATSILRRLENLAETVRRIRGRQG
jgi:hypothetical protein